MKRKRFAWVSPLVYLSVLINLLVCLILVLVLQKKATVTYGLCEKHRRRRLVAGWIVGSLSGLGLLMIGLAIAQEAAALAIVAILMILGVLIYGAIALPVLRSCTTTARVPARPSTPPASH